MYYKKNRVNFIINLYQIVNLMKKKKIEILQDIWIIGGKGF